MIAFVRAVRASSTNVGSRHAESASTSTSTGTAPSAHTADAVGTAVNAGRITSSPGPTPTPASASCNADAPEPTATTCGGGAVVTSDAALAEHVRRLRVHGMTQQYVHEDISQNFRMSEVEAAWLRLSLDRLTDDNARRRTIVAHYRASAPALRWQSPHAAHVYHLCVMRSPSRQLVRDDLAARGVATAVHYPLAVDEQPAYRHFATGPRPESKGWAAECISLPCFPDLTDGEVDRVAGALADLSIAAEPSAKQRA